MNKQNDHPVYQLVMVLCVLLLLSVFGTPLLVTLRDIIYAFSP